MATDQDSSNGMGANGKVQGDDRPKWIENGPQAFTLKGGADNRPRLQLLQLNRWPELMTRMGCNAPQVWAESWESVSVPPVHGNPWTGLLRTFWDPDRFLEACSGVHVFRVRSSFCAPCGRKPPNGPCKNLLKFRHGSWKPIPGFVCPECPKLPFESQKPPTDRRHLRRFSGECGGRSPEFWWTCHRGVLNMDLPARRQPFPKLCQTSHKGAHILDSVTWYTPLTLPSFSSPLYLRFRFPCSRPLRYSQGFRFYFWGLSREKFSKARDQKINAHVFCTKLFSNPSGHGRQSENRGRPHQESVCLQWSRWWEETFWPQGIRAQGTGMSAGNPDRKTYAYVVSLPWKIPLAMKTLLI